MQLRVLRERSQQFNIDNRTVFRSLTTQSTQAATLATTARSFRLAISPFRKPSSVARFSKTSERSDGAAAVVCVVHSDAVGFQLRDGVLEVRIAVLQVLLQLCQPFFDSAHHLSPV